MRAIFLIGAGYDRGEFELPNGSVRQGNTRSWRLGTSSVAFRGGSESRSRQLALGSSQAVRHAAGHVATGGPEPDGPD